MYIGIYAIDGKVKMNNTVATGLRCTRYQLLITPGNVFVTNVIAGRIKYIGFGDNEKKIVADKKIRCFIVIN